MDRADAAKFHGDTRNIARRALIYRPMRRDPVCDMEVDERSAAATSEYAGDTYYFCSPDCKQRFDRDPEQYVSRTERSQT
jgi:YHS domain-containing protein